MMLIKKYLLKARLQLGINKIISEEIWLSPQQINR